MTTSKLLKCFHFCHMHQTFSQRSVGVTSETETNFMLTRLCMTVFLVWQHVKCAVTLSKFSFFPKVLCSNACVLNTKVTFKPSSFFLVNRAKLHNQLEHAWNLCVKSGLDSFWNDWIFLAISLNNGKCDPTLTLVNAVILRDQLEDKQKLYGGPFHSHMKLLIIQMAIEMTGWMLQHLNT